MNRPLIVLKFGGTSVASASRWESIAEQVRRRLPTHRVWVVASAVTEVTDRLERALREARELKQDPENPLPSVLWLKARHEGLADELGIDELDRGPLRDLLADLDRLLRGVALVGEVSPRTRARVLSFGELASTRLGITKLLKDGLPARWLDARTLLRAPDGVGADHYLEAQVPIRHEPPGIEDEVVLTQGFLARDRHGDTCLLGRGGSDTSAALFAALIGAEALEIWTDVHGAFTADPRSRPTARLIQRLSYREAQELATMGAKVLHPRCLAPAAERSIPITIRNTADPDGPATQIGPPSDDGPAVLAVVQRRGDVLLTLSTLSMWQAPGFLARAFTTMAEAGVSVDLVATSETSVTVTLDHVPDGDVLPSLERSLGALGKVRIEPRCAVVSIVGRHIRAALPELAPALERLADREVLLVSQSSEDLNLSFVVREADGDPLVAALHAALVPLHGGDFGPTWEALQRRSFTPSPPATRWWVQRRDELLALSGPRYVYDLSVVRARAESLAALQAPERVYYAMKANPHPEILRTVVAAGLGLECVSVQELRRAKEAAPSAPLLFTPNFCEVAEYAEAFELGVEVTVDGPHLFEQAPELFRGREVALRVDPGGGAGHHDKVITAGVRSKFGHPADDVPAVAEAAARRGVRLVGLHAHVGSGIHDPQTWSRTAERLMALLADLPDVRWLDVGGGLGVPERPGQAPLDLEALDRGLLALRHRLGGRALRLEPGRFLVSEAGVLLAPVTQVRRKRDQVLVGCAVGMNTLLRPALYGAWHGIHNLTRWGEDPVGYHHVVGPICESGDVLGRDRLLPATQPGDVLLIENAGAYGHAMASHYNLRPPADEVTLP